MLNPITKHRSYLFSFIMVWTVIFGIHTIILNFFYEIPGIISLADSALFNFTFAIIGYNLWFVIRFNLREKQKNFRPDNQPCNHLFSGNCNMDFNKLFLTQRPLWR